MKSKIQQEIIDLLEEILLYAEFDKKHLEILQNKMERLKELKSKIGE